MDKPTICDENGEREMTDEEYAAFLKYEAELLSRSQQTETNE